MNRCLSEPTLLSVYMREATPTAQSHLRECADCSQRYARLVGDLETIHRALDTPPPVRESRHAPAARGAAFAWPAPWIPAAVACAALLLVALDVGWLRRTSPVQAPGRATNEVAFAADLSNALFATSDANALSPGVIEVSYLDAALDAGHPCTQERGLAGDCDDELSALVIEND